MLDQDSIKKEDKDQDDQSGIPFQDQQLRLLEAIFFTSAEPITIGRLFAYLPHLTQSEIKALIAVLIEHYQGHGIELIKIGDGYMFRTAIDLADRLIVKQEQPKKLTRAAGETLAIIAYHQPITRAEIEEIRGVAVSRGTLDILLEAGWIMPKGRRRTAGKPVTWATSEHFLVHFGLSELSDLPGIDELKATGLLDSKNLQGLAMRQEDYNLESITQSNLTADEQDSDDFYYPENDEK